LIEIGGHAQAVLFLVVCDSATGLWPEHAVNLSTIKIIGLELLLNVADFGARHVHPAGMHRRVVAPGIYLRRPGKSETDASGMTDAVVRIGRLISTSNLISEIPAQDVSPAHVNNACSRRALRAASVLLDLAWSFRNGS
jgi:hypothetical protein